MNTSMGKYGFNDRLLAESSFYPNLYVGQIVSQHKDLYKAVCDDNELTAEISGKFRFEAKTLLDFPAVNDFVMIDRNSYTNGKAIDCDY